MSFFNLPAELRVLVYHEVARIDLTLYPRHGSYYKRHAFLHVSRLTRKEFEPIALETGDLITATVRKHFGSLFTIDFALQTLAEVLAEHPTTTIFVDFTVAVGLGQMRYTHENLSRALPRDALKKFTDIAAAREGGPCPAWDKKKQARSFSVADIESLTARLSL